MHYRTLRGLSRPQLGALLNLPVPYQTIEKLEKSKVKLTVAWLKKLEVVLNVSAADLMVERPGPEIVDAASFKDQVSRQSEKEKLLAVWDKLPADARLWLFKAALGILVTLEHEDFANRFADLVRNAGPDAS
jgi:transcriptional regulator with XRE-family HTH domain